jgi:hypothetical protein
VSRPFYIVFCGRQQWRQNIFSRCCRCHNPPTNASRRRGENYTADRPICEEGVWDFLQNGVFSNSNACCLSFVFSYAACASYHQAKQPQPLSGGSRSITRWGRSVKRKIGTSPGVE